MQLAGTIKIESPKNLSETSCPSFLCGKNLCRNMNVYFISGLGADRRAFERIQLSDAYTIHHLDWIKPDATESLNDYARRLADGIDTTQPFALVGLSMGGMIATIMTGFLSPQKTILISSIGCNGEFPPLLKFARATKAYKLLPQAVFRPQFLWPVQRLMGTRVKGRENLVREFIEQTDPQFMQWAIGAIVNWKDGEAPTNIYRIHGNRDKMFPLRYCKPNVVIEGGTHFMVWMQGPTVSKALQAALEG